MRRAALLATSLVAAAACGRSAFRGGGNGSPTATPTPGVFRREIDIHHAQVGVPATASLADVPVMIQLVDPSLRSHAFGGHVTSSSGLDIVVAADDATTCAGASSCALRREIVRYDPQSGSLLLWARVPFLRGAAATSDTPLYLGYGGTQLVPNDTATWDVHYKSVWHLGAGSGTTGADSTENSAVNLVGTTWTTSAAIGFSSVGFDGASARAYAGSGNTLTMASGYTVEVWCRTLLANNGSGRLFFHGPINNSPFSSYGIGQVGTKIRFEMNVGNNLHSFDSVSDLVVGAWTRAAGTWDGTTMRLYVGTAQQSTQGVTGTITENNTRSGIGFGNVQPEGPQKFFLGTVQEVRVSDIARGADWIATTARNETAPAAFYTVGPEIPVP